MMTAKVKSVLQANAEQLKQPLTVENVEKVVDTIQEAIFTAGDEGCKTRLQESETRENTIVHDGHKYTVQRQKDNISEVNFVSFVEELRVLCVKKTVFLNAKITKDNTKFTKTKCQVIGV